MEDILSVYKNEIVYFDKKSKEQRHYRLNSGNITNITFDYREIKRFFGLKKELIEVIIFKINDEDIPDTLEILEYDDPNFRRYMGKLRTFTEDNKIPIEIKRLDL